jgi:epsilon-lactone hydrolase
VISVDYRQGYEHKFPAASEDVISVYSALLQEFPPERIGIYGGSAGGMLTLQVTALILSMGLPAPGAIGVFGAGGPASGDGDYFSALASMQQAPVHPIVDVHKSKYGYLAGTASDDPLVNPTLAGADMLGKFPPALLITGTRAFDLSPAIATHRALCRAGTDASLHVFDGVGHCFYYDATAPEGAEAYDTIVRFFRARL